MSSIEDTLQVPTACLRRGLYVLALDRPWVETPFLFQGFTIDDDETLRTLRAHCLDVHVDPVRSDPEALAAARHCAASGLVGARAARSGDRGARARAAESAATARFPSTQAFRDLVAHAKQGRDHARRAVDAVMRDIRLGRSIGTETAREAVTDLVGRVSADASAALWLTNLKDRDEYTSIHCVNVCVLALSYGLHCGLGEDELVELGTGALLHDVGKTLTPDTILNKAGPLTDEEFEIMKRHPEDGYRLLRDAGNVGPGVLRIVRLHHERLHGGGYPFGLVGELIPFKVLVTGLVDAYDAMTSDRAYRRGLAAEDALKELYAREGDAFGADLVADFIRCIGIFPVGSVVELDNGAIGMVVATNDRFRLQPTLLMLRTPDGEAYDKRLLVNLAVEATGRDGDHARRIARARSPAEVGVDVRGIVAREAGIDV